MDFSNNISDMSLIKLLKTMKPDSVPFVEGKTFEVVGLKLLIDIYNKVSSCHLYRTNIDMTDECAMLANYKYQKSGIEGAFIVEWLFEDDLMEVLYWR